MENQKRYKRKVKSYRKSIKTLNLGDSCIVCSRDHGRLIAHRIDFSSHKKFSDLSNDEYEKIKWEKYVLLCYNCHNAVHWVNKYFKMNWKEIYNSLI